MKTPFLLIIVLIILFIVVGLLLLTRFLFQEEMSVARDDNTFNQVDRREEVSVIDSDVTLDKWRKIAEGIQESFSGDLVDFHGFSVSVSGNAHDDAPSYFLEFSWNDSYDWDLLYSIDGEYLSERPYDEIRLLAEKIFTDPDEMLEKYRKCLADAIRGEDGPHALYQYTKGFMYGYQSEVNEHEVITCHHASGPPVDGQNIYEISFKKRILGMCNSHSCREQGWYKCRCGL